MIEYVRDRFHPLHRLRAVPAVRAAVARADVPGWMRVYGVAWKVRARLIRHAAYALLPRSPEPEVAALFLAIERLFRPTVFLDVGANFGYYSWLLTSRDRSIETLMFEPDPGNVGLIEQTLRRVALPGVRVLPCAVSDRCGEARFALDAVSGATGTLEDPADSFAARHWRAQSATVAVPTVTIDGARADGRRVDLIKIDVEGHEERVLDGATCTLAQDRPLLIFECFHRPSPAVRTLEGLGYTVLDAERLTGGTDRATNYLALPPALAAAAPRIAVERSRLSGRARSRGGHPRRNGA
jgi:FkbM family methyltransferase